MEDPIKEKIIELCPDIMELKFGCEVTDERGNIRRVLKFVPKHPQKVDAFVSLDERHQFEPDYFPEEMFRRDFKILGRPITLADVLRAIREADAKLMAIDDQGYLMFLESMTDTTCVYSKLVKERWWNLLKDYDGQEQATKDFIGQLLNV